MASVFLQVLRSLGIYISDVLRRQNIALAETVANGEPVKWVHTTRALGLKMSNFIRRGTRLHFCNVLTTQTQRLRGYSNRMLHTSRA